MSVFKPQVIPSIILFTALPFAAMGNTAAEEERLQRIMHYLVDSSINVNEPASGKSLAFMATTGGSAAQPSPYSYTVGPLFFGAYVCPYEDEKQGIKDICTVENVRSNPHPDYSILATEETEKGFALQVERMNMSHGTGIYDAATWQIAVALYGKEIGLPAGQKYLTAARAQTSYLIKGQFANQPEEPGQDLTGQNRAITNGGWPIYNGTPIYEQEMAYTFRMVPTSWGLWDPFTHTDFLDYISVTDPDSIIPGQTTWLDWKGITGENAWAHLIAPLQADYLAHMAEHPDDKLKDVVFAKGTLQNAVNVLYPISLLQAKIGGIFYAPEGTAGNTGAPTIPNEISIENNASMLAGLLLLEQALETKSAEEFKGSLPLVQEILYGRDANPNATTDGLISFFINHAWDASKTRFYTNGLAEGDDFITSASTTNAVDVNSWTIATLGPEFLDAKLGTPGITYKIWETLRPWGGYFHNGELLGVGFDDSQAHTGKGQDIMSVEWTYGAIAMLRSMKEYYKNTDILDAATLQGIDDDIKSMRNGVDNNLTTDTYATTSVFMKNGDVPRGKAIGYEHLDYHSMTIPGIDTTKSLGMMYASKRYFIPFGWYANPVPSTASTTWAVMEHYKYNPFAFGGHYKGVPVDLGK